MDKVQDSSDTMSNKHSVRSKKTHLSLTSLRKPATYIEKYECRSDDEIQRDKQDFDRFLDQYANDCQKQATIGIDVEKRLTQSFDENVLREMYDGDFGCETEFNSDGSWISFPPSANHANNPYN